MLNKQKNSITLGIKIIIIKNKGIIIGGSFGVSEKSIGGIKKLFKKTNDKNIKEIKEGTFDLDVTIK